MIPKKASRAVENRVFSGEDIENQDEDVAASIPAVGLPMVLSPRFCSLLQTFSEILKACNKEAGSEPPSLLHDLL
jgi:hypothetical protein